MAGYVIRMTTPIFHDGTNFLLLNKFSIHTKLIKHNFGNCICMQETVSPNSTNLHINICQ